jgi:hypothetical protein
MSISRFTLRAAFAVAVGALLAACAQHGGSLIPGSALSPATLVSPDRKPPKCKGQTTTKQYASLTVTLSTQGGSFCIPEFGGFGGSVKYPSATPSVNLQLISSTTDYADLPQLGSGTAIFYLQLAISGGTSFGTNVQAGGGLASHKIQPGQPYTAFGEAYILSIPYQFKPCYATATKSKYGGLIGGLGTLLKGESVPTKAHGFIEIYAGKQTATPC